ncbi:MAG: hypothetical protein JW741_04415 [Sedimentisphaerales bacterium]|nr:hypothetical protein [Sedimentisphaerales bacterium]
MISQAENKKNRNDWLVLAFGATAVLAGALAFAKGASFIRGPALAEGVVAQAMVRNGREPNDIGPYLAEAREIAAALKEKNLFIKKPPRQHPVTQVDGILGSEALIAGNWYKAGDKVADANIVAVEPTEVRIEWDGQVKTFPPMAATGGDRPSPPPGPEKGGPPTPHRPEAAKAGSGPKPVQVETGAGPAPPGGDSLAWMGVNLPPQVREKLLNYWNGMSKEEQAEARRKWSTMPDDQRRQAIESIGKRM